MTIEFGNVMNKEQAFQFNNTMIEERELEHLNEVKENNKEDYMSDWYKYFRYYGATEQVAFINARSKRYTKFDK